MGVLVEMSDGKKDSFVDMEGEYERAFRIQDGVLFIMNKPAGQPWGVLWEYSPAGYKRVQGKRYTAEIKSPVGTEGKVSFGGAKLLA